jgi:hypothetical protein
MPLALMVIVAFTFSACKKVKTAEPMGDAGQTLVKMIGGGSPYAIVSEAISFVNTPYTLKNGVIDIRRDVPNNAELNRTMTVVVKDDVAAVTAANPAYIVMPAAWYTLQTSDNVPKVGGSGGTWTFTFKPGEFAKQIYITVPNATLLNPSSLYGLGFTITTADANGIITASKTIVVQIGAKNDWDGVYTDDFCNYHPSLNTGYTCSTTVVHLITTGANKVKIFWPLANVYCMPSILSGDYSYFGAQEPEITINTSTNAVTVQNTAAGAVTFYTMGVGSANNYDPIAKQFNFKYGYSYASPGVFDAACREWTVKMTYTGPR